MGKLLKAAELGEVPEKERFQKLYETYIDTTFSDWDWDKEDIIEARRLFLGHGSKPQKLQWAAHMFADFDAGGGMIEYFKKDKIDSDPELVQAFLIFAGCWIDVAIKASFGTDPNYGAAYTFKGEWSQDNVGEIVPTIQKVFFEYEKQRLLFPQVEASLKQFSFVNFKKTLSEKINNWLKTNPKIKDLYYLSKIQATVPIKYGFTNFLSYNPINVPEKLKNITNYKNGFSQAQRTQLEKLGFFSRETNYETYIPSDPTEKNDITVDENLESADSAKFETSKFLFLTKVNENSVRQAYSRLGLSLLRIHAEAIRLESVQELSLKELRKMFKEDTDKAVNETNENYISPGNDAAKGAIGYRIAQNILNNIRANALLRFLEEYKDTTDALSDEDAKKKLQEAEETVRNNEEITGTDTDASEQTEEDIKAKQKFLKQCLLMSRLDFFSKLNIAQIKKKDANSIHYKKPYKGRLYLIDEKNIQKDKSSIINKLLIPNRKSIGPFLDIKPSEHASLVPKIRLVKVYSSGSTLTEHEFKFPKHSNTSRVNNLSSPSLNFDRGADFGIKEFSFSFDGTTPATAKNDITANLKLYFQSFQDFVEKKAANGGHRYVDLLILPGGDRGTKKGSGTPSALQYDPSYYRIRADIGWEAESAPNAGIKKAIHKINKTFYLNMVDHDIDIRDDGSVEISVSYRAYVETALKGTTLDALASRESRKALAESREKYREILLSKNCNLEQLTLIRAQFLQIEENLRKNSFQSIIKRLIENGLLYNVQVSSASAAAFERSGYISAPAVFVGDAAGSEETLAKKSNPNNFKMKQNKFNDIKLSNSNDNKMINYFFLADLLYVVLECLYEESSEKINEKYIPGTENFKFLLSSFQYISTFEQSKVESINIGNIPISVELFNEWFTDNIIKQERTSYPVMYFIRDIAKYLVTEILLESCFKNDLDKKLQFKTTSFLGMKKKGECPISSILGDEAILDVGPAYDKGDLPLSADIEGITTPVKDLFNYITIFAETTRGKTDKRGIKTDDEKNGIMHYQIGRDRGILKKIKFSKTDMQYIREARFFRHGNDGLMQLSAVYKVSMDMVGNTLYYPGMEVFIDPRGLLGAGTDFNPTVKNTIANKLGFGGYHLITSVKSSIGPGKFTTTVDALFSYNGDGDPKSKIIGSKDEITVPAIDKTFLNEGEQSGTEKDYCEAISDVLYQEAAAVGYGFENEADISRVPDAPADTPESLDRKNNTQESLPEPDDDFGSGESLPEVDDG